MHAYYLSLLAGTFFSLTKADTQCNLLMSYLVTPYGIFFADELFSSSWCNIQAPEVEALILNFRTRNYTIPEFVNIVVKLKVIIVTNYGFFPAELSNFQLLSSLPNLKRIRLEKVSISSLCNTLVQLRSLCWVHCTMSPAHMFFVKSSFNEHVFNVSYLFFIMYKTHHE